ncbi:hypothetical protein JCM10908_000471 [Rhodotorula pacifica]|uniref:uncharacterized protein n=1 Tax=Rhodotorula pacifica TaxID=1495444 RepID=UPI00316F1016
MSSDAASLYSVTSTTPLTAAAGSARRANKSSEEIFQEIMSINASSGAPHVKAYMLNSTKSEKRATTAASTATSKAKKTRSPPKSSQEIADEIMRINAVHGHPSVQGYLAGMK